MILNQTELPDGWQLAPIRDITLRAPQKNPARNPASPFKYVDVSSVDNALCKITNASELIGSQAPSRARKEIRANDVRFATVRPTLRRIALVPDYLDGQIASTGYCVLRSNKELVSPGYLYFCVRTDSFVDAIGKLQRGANYPAVRDTDILRAQIPLPPLDEQRKIATVLGVVQKAIEEQERLIALTTELKKTLLHQLFTHGLRGEPQKKTEIGLVPESWEVVPLGSLAKVGNGSTPKRDNNTYWKGGTIPWLNSTKIHELFIDGADQFVTQLAVKECHLPVVKQNSLLIAITGQGKTLGNSALVSFDTCINQHLAYVQFNSPSVLPEYVLWYMQTRYDHLRSISQAGGTTKGALTCGYLKTYPVPVPSMDEQRDIARVFSALIRKERAYARRHEGLTTLLSTMLHQLMSARIRVLDIDPNLNTH